MKTNLVNVETVAMLSVCLALSGGCGSGDRQALEERNRQLEDRIALLTQEVAGTRRRLADAETALQKRTLMLSRERNQLRGAAKTFRDLEQRLIDTSESLEASEENNSAMQKLLADAQNQLRGVSLILRVTNDKYLAALGQEQTATGPSEAGGEPPEIGEGATGSTETAEEDLAAPPPMPEETGETRESRLSEAVTPTAAHPLQRQRFSRIADGMNSDELVDYIGPPDRIEGSPPQYYIYNLSFTYDVDPHDPDASVRLGLRDGVVRTILFAK